jgi:hypothetical protein
MTVDNLAHGALLEVVKRSEKGPHQAQWLNSPSLQQLNAPACSLSEASVRLRLNQRRVASSSEGSRMPAGW